MNLKKIALYSLAAIGSAYLLMLVFVSFLSGNVVTLLRSATSPDHQRMAQLVIEQSDSSPTKIIRLSVHRSDTPNRSVSASLSEASTTDIELTWLAERQLEVIYPASLELSNMFDRLDDVEILYTPRLPSNPGVKGDTPHW